MIQVWGPHGRCSLGAIKPIVRPYFPGADPNAPPPPELAEPGVLEGIATVAGLTPTTSFDVSWSYVYPDEDSLTDSRLSAGGIGVVAGDRAPEVRRALIEVWLRTGRGTAATSSRTSGTS